MNNTPTAPAPVAEAPALPVSNPFQRRILAALNVARYPSLSGPARVSVGHIYGGTVPADVVAKRRAANKAARKARRVQRKAA